MMDYIKQDHIHSVGASRTWQSQCYCAGHRMRSHTFHRSSKKAEDSEKICVDIEQHYCRMGEKAVA